MGVETFFHRIRGDLIGLIKRGLNDLNLVRVQTTMWIRFVRDAEPQERVELAFNPIQARLFLPFKGPRGTLGKPLMISGTSKASPMRLCTVIVLLKAYQNTKRNFQKYDLLRHNDIITKKLAKFGPPRNQTNYISFER